MLTCPLLLAPSCGEKPTEDTTTMVTAPLSLSDCQRLSDQFGIVANSTFGLAPPEIQASWKQFGCNTAPQTSTDLCQKASDIYGITAWVGFGYAPQSVQDWWIQNGCQTSPLVQESICQRAADTYGLTSVMGGTLWGSAPGYMRDWWSTGGGCNATPHYTQSACQQAADLYGIVAGHTFGFSPTEVQAWWSSPSVNCQTSATTPLQQQCQNASNFWGMAIANSGGAPSWAQQWFSQNGCTTQPTCQGMSEMFGLNGVTGDTGYGGSPASPVPVYVQNAWFAIQCRTAPLLTNDNCQRAANLFDMSGTNNFAFSPTFVQNWWSAKTCNTSQHAPLLMPVMTASQNDVLTRNYNNQRTGANTFESSLNATNATSAHLGRRFQVMVDDQVYGQILFRKGVPIPGQGNHDMFFVVTVNNTVYGFDASTGGTYWPPQNFTPSGERPGWNADLPFVYGRNCGANVNGYQNFTENIGIVGTPVISPESLIMYFVTRTIFNRTYNAGETPITTQRLHAIDITTGQEIPHSPVTIQFAANQTTEPFRHNQRAALALGDDAVYVAWGAFCDWGSYHGTVKAYDPMSLLPKGTFIANTTNGPSDGQGAGIWHGGGGILQDTGGFVYVATGNGPFNIGASNYGQSLMKLQPDTLGFSDYFNATITTGNDQDFGSSGPVMLPGNNLLTVGSKDGIVYLLNKGDLCQQESAHKPGCLLQELQAVKNPANRVTTHIHGTNVAWVGPDGATYLYVWGENDFLRRYRLNPSTGLFDTTAANVGSFLPPNGMPGGMLTLSSSGSTSGTGVVWATLPLSGDAENATVSGRVYAFDAETLAMLWRSTDSFYFAKFNPPVVAFGQVFVPTFSNVINVYGITH